jgi:outer membrane protein OmpA-like peptidoglycan-associated protein
LGGILAGNPPNAPSFPKRNDVNRQGAQVAFGICVIAVTSARWLSVRTFQYGRSTNRCPSGIRNQRADEPMQTGDEEMSASSSNFGLNLVRIVLAAALALPASAGLALAAEQPSAEQIIKALKPTRVTRGLDANRAEEARFINTLRNRPTRSLTTVERDQIASITNNKPTVDLEINFEFDSATIGTKAARALTELGQALTSADLKGGSFFINGYTDAKGLDPYNQDLSERRADAVKRFLSDKFGIEATKLITVGYGKSRLKNSSDPYAPENRRVQVVNLAD